MTQTYQYFSRMVQILNVKLRGFFNESKHILVLGGSLHPDEPVIVQDPNGYIQVIRIQDFPTDCRGWKGVSLNKSTFNLRWSPVATHIIHNYAGPMFKIRVETNREVRITKDHSVLVWNGTEILEKQGVDLKVGEYVLVPRSVPQTTQTTNVDDFLIDENLVTITGFYMAEGSLKTTERRRIVNGKQYVMRDHGIMFDFGPNDQDNIIQLTNAVSHFHRKLGVVPRKDSRGIRCTFTDKKLCAFLEKHVGRGAHHKRLPSFVYNISRDLQKLLLDCWMKGDAGTTVSKGLANDILYLLPFLGWSGHVKTRPPRTSFIKGRKVNCLACFELVVKQPKTDFFLPPLYAAVGPLLELLKFGSFNGLDTYISQGLTKLTPRILNYLCSGRRLKRLNVLRLLLQEPNLRCCDVAQKTHAGRPTMFFLLQRLLQEGWITVSGKGKSGDADSNLYTISSRGRELLQRIDLIQAAVKGSVSFCRIVQITSESYSGPVHDLSIPGDETVSGDENFVGGFGGIICHNSGSGKTSTLLLLCYLCKQNGETILWRDDTSTEWLSMVDQFPWRVFIPNECEFHYKHPNIEYIYYDPWNLKTLFKEIKRGEAHAIEFDPFAFETSLFISFWSRFFYDLYRWKGPDIRSRVAFFTDELNDLAAGAKRGYVPRQLQLASNIYLSLKKFRKERIRLVACYDEQTRVLTQEGLKDHETLKIGAMGLSINLQTKEIEWKPIVNIHKYPYTGKMVHFEGKSFDVSVTPNHQMLLSTGQRTNWQNLHFEEASRASKRSMFRFPQGTWTAQGFPDLTNDFFYLLGLYIGDGSTYAEIKKPTKSGLRRKEYLTVRDDFGRFCQHGSPAVLSYHRPRVYLFIPREDKSRKKVEDALARLNITWNNHGENIYFDTTSSTKFEVVLIECGSYAKEKHIPRKWLDGASAKQLKSLFEGLIDSDGNNAHSYKTVSEQLAVDFVELVTKLGWSATIKVLPAQDIFIKDHIAHSKQYYVISVHFRPKYKPFENIPQEEDYSGVVWCPEVADNHNLLVERNGRFVFCGNSSHAFGDLHKPVREAFNFYIFKRMDAGSLPEQFRRYNKVIERLELNEMMIVDEERSFNKMEIEELVKPKRISVRWKGTITPLSKRKLDELAQWKTRTVMLIEAMHQVYAVPYKQIAPFLGYAEQSGLNNLMRKYSTKELTPQIENLVVQLKQLEKEGNVDEE